MRNNTLLLLILFSINFGAVWAQKPLNPSLENLSPPSPNAAALGKFGSIPVGPATGIPQVGVPIYAYENKATGLNLSVSLDYHAGGIRVDEMPSSTGIGWALNAGGVVSRTMRGIYDEHVEYGYLNTGPLPATELEGNPTATRSARPFNQIEAWMLDGQTDVFSFNFNGRSGRFELGKNDDYVLLDMQKLKIEKVIGPLVGPTSLYKLLSKFIITDENGFRYVFDAAETTHNYAMATSAAVYTSAWYLTSILTPSQLFPSPKESINFTYEEIDYSHIVGRSVSEATPYPGASLYRGMTPRKFSASISAQRITGKRLTGISFPNGVRLSFEYSTTERTDPKESTHKGDYLLKKIKISSGNAQRGFQLEHDYSLNRPTLKKVIPFAGAAEVTQPGYEFTYDIPLPDRLSTQQDHWGFYNSNQGDLIPSEILPVAGGTGNYGNYHELGGGSRDTDFTRCKAGSLRRIKYPTGGYTDFELEVNQALDPRLNQETAYVKQIYSRTGTASVSFDASQTQSVSEFEYQGDLNAQTEFTLQIQSVSSITCSSTSCKVVMEIYSPTQQLVYRGTYDPPVGSYAPDQKFTLSNLALGVHKITTYTQGLSNYSSYSTLKWVEKRLQNPLQNSGTIGRKQLYVGGLRVKKISDYDAIASEPVQVKEYEYLLEDGQTPSGTLGIYPVYSSPVCYYYREQEDDTDFQLQRDDYDGMCRNPNLFSRSSSTVHTLASVNGSPVVYTRVVEKVNGKGQYLGRTERYFKSFANSPINITYPFPYTPPQYREWIYGQLENVMVYDESNFLVRKEVHGYQTFEDYDLVPGKRLENFRSVTIAPVKYLLIGTSYWGHPCYFKSNNFYPTIGRSQASSVTTYEYDRSGGTVTTTVSNLFDQKNLYLRSTTTASSKGEQLVTSYTYPQDLVSQGGTGSSIYQQMLDRNIINPVVEQTQSRDGQQQQLVRSTYFNPHPEVYVPQTVAVQSGTFPMETRVRYHSYDADGRMLSASKENDTRHSYLWGYGRSHLIAEVKNATYEQIAAVLGETVLNKLQSDAPGTDAEVRQMLQVLRTDPSLKDAMVTSYTYNPLNGVTSKTDPNGVTSYYEYDDMGRLQTVKDRDQQPVSQYQYHYKQ
jgi:YD repeat-containing protein